jgi:hypothetical protein
MNPTLLKKLDPIARKIGLYTSYELSEEEYIGRGPPGLVRKLLDRGYENPPTFMGIPLAAAKEHPETGRVHDYSLRRIGTNPRMQYHVHLWYAESSKDLHAYSHYEFRPDFKRVGDETTGEMINRLRTHYRPVYNESYIQGKADPTLRGLVE